MSLYKRIYWRTDLERDDKGRCFANIHILKGYTDESLAAFQSLAKGIRKIVPSASDKQIHCGKVRGSRTVDGFTLVRWEGYLDAGYRAGWDQLSCHSMDYTF